MLAFHENSIVKQILAVDFGAQVEAASDHVMLAADHLEGLDVASLQQQLLDKQTALKLCSVHLQELQARHCYLLCSASLCCPRHFGVLCSWDAKSSVPALLPGFYVRLADDAWLICIRM